jgi:osmotically-inducible protein OsmY
MNPPPELERNGQSNRPTAWVKRPNTNRSSDVELATAAVDAIECLTTVPLESIQVTARNGWLQLEGTVAWEQQRTTLEEVTRRLPGVRGVIDSIAIKSLAAGTAARAAF